MTRALRMDLEERLRALREIEAVMSRLEEFAAEPPTAALESMKRLQADLVDGWNDAREADEPTIHRCAYADGRRRFCERWTVNNHRGFHFCDACEAKTAAVVPPLGSMRDLSLAEQLVASTAIAKHRTASQLPRRPVGLMDMEPRR